jgi:hypothetical protein
MKNLLAYFIIFFLLGNYSLLSQSGYNKVAGVCFRMDDYHDPATRLIPYIDIFNTRGLKFTYSVNFGIHIMTPAFLSTVQQMQSQGFEIADHSPDHETRYFDVPLSDTTFYHGLNGVDHIINLIDYARICLEWDSVKTDTYPGEGLISISGNTVTSVISNEFTTIMHLPSTLDDYSMNAIYIPSLNKLFKFNANDVTGNNIFNLKSFWDESNVNLTLNNVAYHKVGVYDVFYSIDAIKVLAIRQQQYCDNNGITRPTTWIQPGGRHPQFYRADIKAALESMGYTAAGVFADPFAKLYNSYDPNDDNRYGMNWEDFNEESETLAQCKKKIADWFARHRVSIGQSHLLNGSPPSSFSTYLQKTADILDWCIAKGIPVKTYKEWAQLLYKTPQNPYVNVMPSVDVDLDEGGDPDGFNYYSGISIDGVSGNFNKSFVKTGNGQLFNIWELGGVEKGENYFGMWIKGIGDIEVYFVYSLDPYNVQSYTFNSNSTGWVHYNCTFQIPDTISAIQLIEIYSVNTSGTVKVGGFELRKNSSNQFVKVLLQGPYNGLTMNTSLNSQGLIPLTQPFNSVTWNYSGAESVSSIPSNVVDWLLLDLRTGVEGTTIVGKRAAFLKSDGSIVDLDGNSAVSFTGVSNGNYYLGIHHRNHLSILSQSPLSFSNGNITANYDFTTGQNKVYGTNPMKDLGGGKYGMIAGDASGDGTINATDLNNYWIPQNGTPYDYQTKTSDFNLDASINATDLNSFWIPNNGNSTQVP